MTNSPFSQSPYHGYGDSFCDWEGSWGDDDIAPQEPQLTPEEAEERDRVNRETAVLEGISKANPAQKEAIMADFSRPLVVIAGAGTGKTFVIIKRIDLALLNPNTPASSILAITFTNKAAAELKERAAVTSGPSASLMDVSTFHSFATKILRQIDGQTGIPPNFSIQDAKDAEKTIRDVFNSIFEDQLSAEDIKNHWSGTKPSAYIEAISEERQHSITKKEWSAPELIAPFYESVKEKYQEFKKNSNILDYDDLEHELNRALDIPSVRYMLHRRYRRIFVDEYQDTNPTEYEIIRKIAETHQGLTCVGDPDQSIYRWRGADVRNILEFNRDWPGCKVVRLEENYRSTPEITRIADNLISHNEIRYDKIMKPTRPSGSDPKITCYRSSSEEAMTITNEIANLIANGTPPEEIAVIARSAAALMEIQTHMIRRRIYFMMHAGSNIAEKTETKLVAAWIRIIINPDDQTALLYALLSRPRGIGKGTITEKAQIAQRTGHTLEEMLRMETLSAQTDPKKQAKYAKIETFLSELSEARQYASAGATPTDIIEDIIVRSGLIEDIEDEIQKAEKMDDRQKRESKINTAENRRRNLELLIESAGTSDNIAEFANNIALTNEKPDDGKPAVWLGTIHASKALEFGHVFLPAFEKDILPSKNAEKSADPFVHQEERNLGYVAVTRAKDYLSISHCESRYLYGTNKPCEPSPFIEQLEKAK